MAHQARLKIERQEYLVTACEYEFVQPIQENGQPAGRPGGSLIHLVIVSPDNNDLFLHDWMQNATEHKDGRIIFSVVDTGTPSIKTLHFKQAYCVRLSEHFDVQNSVQMYTRITISATEISFGDLRSVVFNNDRK